MTLELVVIALALALAPLSLVAFLVLLATTGGTRRAAGFIAGWMTSLVVIVVLTLALTGGRPPEPSTAPANGVLIAKIVVGLLLLAIAGRRYARRHRPVSPPAWRGKLEHMNVAAAASFGFLFQPWPLVGAGALIVASADLSHASTVAVLVGFILLASSSFLGLETYAIAAPEPARLRLNRFQAYLETHTDVIITWLATAIGVWLAAVSLYQLLT